MNAHPDTRSPNDVQINSQRNPVRDTPHTLQQAAHAQPPQARKDGHLAGWSLAAIHQFRNRHEQLKEELKKRDAEIVQLKARLASSDIVRLLSERIKSISKERDELQANASVQKTKREQALARAIELEAEPARKQSQALQVRLDVAERSSQALRSQLEQLRAEMTRVRDETKELQSQLVSQTTLRQQHEHAAQLAKQDLDAAKVEVTQMESKLVYNAATMNNCITGLNQQNQSSKAEIGRLNKEVSELKQERTLVSQRANVEWQEKLEEVRREKRTLQDQIGRMQKIIDDSKATIASLRLEYDYVQKDAHQKDSHLADLQKFIQRQKTDLASAQLATNQTKQQLENTREDDRLARQGWIQLAQTRQEALEQAQARIAFLETKAIKVDQGVQYDPLLDIPDFLQLPDTPLLPATPLFLPSPSPASPLVPLLELAPLPDTLPPEEETPSIDIQGDAAPMETPTDDARSETPLVQVFQKDEKLFIRAPKSSTRRRGDGYQKVHLGLSPFTIDVRVSWPVSASDDEENSLPQPFPESSDEFEGDSVKLEPEGQSNDRDAPGIRCSLPKRRRESSTSEDERSSSRSPPPISQHRRPQKRLKRMETNDEQIPPRMSLLRLEWLKRNFYVHVPYCSWA